MNESYTRAPHRRSQSSSGPSPNAALLIDFDNVTMAMRSNLGQELRNFLNSDIVRGKVSVQRAYADWRRYPQYIVPLSEASIDLIFAPAYGSSKKNATDIRLAIDALELVFTRPEIGTFLLLSGDSDFSSLVLKLKEYGKYVIGVGLQESTSDLLVQNCDEYYSYNSLSGLTSAEEMDTQRHDPWELVEKAVRKMDERSDVMRSDRLKQVMLEFDGTFDEKDHGFSKFNRFLAEASSRGLVQLRKIGDGHYEVAPVARRETEDAGAPSRPEPVEPAGDGSRGGEAPAKRERRGGKKKRGGGPGARGDGGSRPARGVDASSLRGAYDLLRDVVGDLSEEDTAVRDSEVKREMLRRDESFDEGALGFSKFSRFLRQAYDEGVIEVTTDPDGNYHLQPAGAEPVTFEEPGEAPEPPAEEAAAQAASGPGEAPAATSGSPGGPEEREEPAEPAGRTPAAADGEDRSGPGGVEEPAAEKQETPSRGRSGRGRGGLGRFRRGSRGKSGPASGEAGGSGGGVPGPVDDGGDGSEETEEASAAPAGSDGSAGGAGSGARRRRAGGLGRFRKGRSSGGGGEASGDGEEEAGDEVVPGPVDGGPATTESAPSGAEDAGDGAAAGAPEATPAGSSAPAGPARAPVPEEASDDPVTYMVGTYPGVGRKTAEKLVEAFGDSVFDVIDREPGRLTEVLPDHRARAVVEAREEDRERIES